MTAATSAPLPPTEKLPLHIKLGNGFGSVAYGVKDNGFATLLMLFYNQVLGLDAKIVGFILLIALLLDAIVDPLVGYWGDKTHSRWGKRHPWMYAAILPMAAAWMMLWHPPLAASGWLYGYLLLFAFLMRAAVSCYEIPALSVVPGLTSDYDERTSLTRWRFMFGWAGGLLMLTLAFAVYLVPSERYPVGQLNVDGYQLYGWTGAILMIVATSVSAITTHRRIARLDSSPPTHLPLGATLRKIGRTLGNRAFLILLASSLFAYVNQGMTFSATTYMLSYYWEMPQAGFLAYAVTLFVGVVGAFLIVGLLQKRIEKRTGAVGAGIAALLLAVTPYALRYFGQFPANHDPALIPALFTLVTLSNACAVASMMLGQSMAADIIEASQEKTGERSEGLFFSAYFFVQKCATGVGLFLTGLIISAAGIPAQAEPGMIGQTILNDFAVYYLIVLVGFSLASIAFIARFPISRSDHETRIAAMAAVAAETARPHP
ncbi:MAG: MFS transporter [Sphingopyxis sp.]|nr:MFS transporter [Sphingopyxis sp.]